MQNRTGQRPAFPQRNRTGVSVIDMVVTTLIIGVIAAAVSPRFSAMLNRYRAKSAAAMLVADVNDARDHAKLASRTTTIEFTTSPPGYSITGVDSLNNSGSGRNVNFNELGFRVALSSINIDSGRRLTFNEHGQPLNAAGAALASGQLLVVCGATTSLINIDPTTGRAQ